MEKVKVPKDVFEGITAVRDSGLTNMMDVPAVARLAQGMGYDEAAQWVRSNRKSYAEGFFHGFEAVETES
jgi:hypothetical protein